MGGKIIKIKLILKNTYLIFCVCVHTHVCANANGGQRTTHGSQFILSALWVLRIKLRLL